MTKTVTRGMFALAAAVDLAQLAFHSRDPMVQFCLHSIAEADDLWHHPEAKRKQREHILAAQDAAFEHLQACGYLTHD